MGAEAGAAPRIASASRIAFLKENQHAAISEIGAALSLQCRQSLQHYISVDTKLHFQQCIYV